VTINEIRYYWETGVYGIKDLKRLVAQGVITADEYHEITRMHYS
jgi:hypothetical protein